MKARIIELSNHPTCKEVLLYIGYSQSCSKCVNIIAWHTLEDNEEMIQETYVSFEEYETMPERFIEDFSEKSAYEFANRNES